MRGFWGRGVEVIGEWGKKRESDGRVLWGPQILRCQGKGILAPNGIKIHVLSHFWR